MIIDRDNKLILRENIDGQNRSVGFLEYRERTSENRVITGVIESLPHLDPYAVGVELLTFLREKYPRPDWSLETEPEWCRAEYLRMIEKSIAEGHNFYDVIGTSTDGEVNLIENWKYQELASGGASIDQLPTSSLWPVMKELDNE